MAPSQSAIYLDGKLVEKVSGSYSNERYYNARVGHAYDGAGYVWFKGMLDEVMIWNRVLSESEVKELYDLHRQ